MFSLTTLLDFGADVNIFIKKSIPSKYWVSASRKIIGLGEKTLQYEVPKAVVCFDSHCIKLKFAVGDIPVDCILGNVFPVVVEPHGSIRLKNNRVGYFITVPTSDGKFKRIDMPYISNPGVYTMVWLCRSSKRLKQNY